MRDIAPECTLIKCRCPDTLTSPLDEVTIFLLWNSPQWVGDSLLGMFQAESSTTNPKHQGIAIGGGGGGGGGGGLGFPLGLSPIVHCSDC